MKYIVYFTTTASTSVEVEAEDEVEAGEKAYEEIGTPSLCAQCSGWGSDTYIDMSGDWEFDSVEEKK